MCKVKELVKPHCCAPKIKNRVKCASKLLLRYISKADKDSRRKNCPQLLLVWVRQNPWCYECGSFIQNAHISIYVHLSWSKPVPLSVCLLKCILCLLCSFIAKCLIDYQETFFSIFCFIKKELLGQFKMFCLHRFPSVPKNITNYICI